jgi:predicted anti-sigma-YlaC factor YlaD
MKCLSIEQIYLYIEKELSPAQSREIKEHLATCQKCRNAFEERKLLVKAAKGLSLWETPPEFTRQVMARIGQAKILPSAWIKGAAAALASTSIMLLVIYLVTGQNLSTLVFGLNHSLWNYVRNFLPALLKIFKLASLIFGVIQQFTGYLLKAFSWLKALTSFQIQLTISIIAVISIAILIYGIKRIILIGEKT